MIEIQNTKIVKRLTDRLSIYPDLNARMIALHPFVVPVTDVGVLLKDVKAGLFTVSITGTGTHTITTVPAGKRWEIITSSLSVASGTYNFQELRATKDGVMAYLDSFTATTNRFYNFEGKNIPIDTRTIIEVYVGSHSATGNLDWRIWYTEEDAF